MKQVRLRLIAPERGLLYLGAETAERYLPDAGEEPAAVRNPLLPPDPDQEDSSGPVESAASASEKKSRRRWIIGGAAAAVVLIAAAAGIIPGIGALLVVGPLEYGMAYIFLKQARDHQPVQLGDMFRGFQDDFGGTFLIGLMTSLFTFLWSLLFVIPGIVKAYAYSMAYYIKLDHPDYGWNACITASRQMMDGHKWE